MTISKLRTLDSIKITRTIDTDADTSFIGEYSRTPGPDDRTIDRVANGDAGSRGYAYFIAAMSGDETGNPDSVQQDYERMQDIANGQICFYGIGVRAVIKIPECGNCSRLMNIDSTSLWGIESDSDTAYIREVANDQLSEIRAELNDLGIDDADIDAAMADADYIDIA